MRAPARARPSRSPARRSDRVFVQRFSGIGAPFKARLKDNLMAKEATRVRRRERKNIVSGVAHVNSTFNNTMITITDAQGNTISWSSAAQIAAEDAVRKAAEHGMRTLEVEVSGPGSGRESALRAIQAAGVNVTSIRDVTPIPHNGCRPRKRRRV